jgi:hypothetical protein
MHKLTVNPCKLAYFKFNAIVCHVRTRSRSRLILASMWVKGSPITTVPRSRGTRINLCHAYDTLCDGYDGSDVKVKQLYSFVITCIPYMEVAGLEKRGPGVHGETYNNIFAESGGFPCLSMIAWYCKETKMSLSPNYRKLIEGAANSFAKTMDFTRFLADTTSNRIK